MKTVTIFGISALNDNYTDTPLHSYCIESWKNLAESYKKYGYKVRIKIYKWYHPLVLLGKLVMRKHFEKSKSKAVQTDALKVWFLSLFKYHVFLDFDCYICEQCSPICETKLRKAFEFMVCWEDKKPFKKLADLYRKGYFINMNDKTVHTRICSMFPFMCDLNDKLPSYIKHLFQIDNYNKVIVGDDIEVLSKYTTDNGVINLNKKHIPRALNIRDEQLLNNVLNICKQEGKQIWDLRKKK